MDLVVDLLLVTEAVGGSWFTNQPPAFDDQSISHALPTAAARPFPCSNVVLDCS